MNAMALIDDLKRKIESEARKGDMSLDTPVYEQAGRDPHTPILIAGNLNANLAFFARDLGRDEVLQGEPLIGGAGQRVRKAVYRALFQKDPPRGDTRLQDATDHILLTNTVPYKPIENKAYPGAVKERFRPFVAELLVCHWKGDRIITMGTEAFLWFEPYAEKGAIQAFWKRKDRFESEITVTLRAECEGKPASKEVTLAPLPHPSPLNRTYLELFPDMLRNRLEKYLTSQ